MVESSGNRREGLGQLRLKLKAAAAVGPGFAIADRESSTVASPNVAVLRAPGEAPRRGAVGKQGDEQEQTRGCARRVSQRGDADAQIGPRNEPDKDSDGGQQFQSIAHVVVGERPPLRNEDGNAAVGDGVGVERQRNPQQKQRREAAQVEGRRSGLRQAASRISQFWREPSPVFMRAALRKYCAATVMLFLPG